LGDSKTIGRERERKRERDRERERDRDRERQRERERERETGKIRKTRQNQITGKHSQRDISKW